MLPLHRSRSCQSTSELPFEVQTKPSSRFSHWNRPLSSDLWTSGVDHTRQELGRRRHRTRGRIFSFLCKGNCPIPEERKSVWILASITDGNCPPVAFHHQNAAISAGEAPEEGFRPIPGGRLRLFGGEGGIRTPDSLSTMPDFESGAFNRALPPLREGTSGCQPRRTRSAQRGAGDRDRTGDIQLGKLTFCH